jgi:arginine repressor
MANDVSKIERLGLADRVRDYYLTDNIRTAKAIAEKLREDGVKISDASVARYLSRVKDDFRAAARQVVYDHVNKELPKDLDALEEMEATCLDWSRMDMPVLIERTADAAAAIAGEVDAWAAIFNSYHFDKNSSTRAALVKDVIKKSLVYISMADEKMENRLKAIKAAASIIELKLRHATGLDADSKGNIIIMDRSSEGPVHEVKPSDRGKDQARVMFTINGGNRG